MGKSPIRLFIDTNVYLSFFHFAKDDLEELRKLSPMLGHGEVTLLLTEQVVEEFWRNRDNKIADVLKRIREADRRPAYPRLLHDYDEYKRLQSIVADQNRLQTALMRRAEDAARERSFAADSVIADLFAKATHIKSAESHVSRARARQELGSPPGKSGSLGDAVSWEALLETAPAGDDLHFISEDSDWLSPLGGGAFNSYLLREWSRKKHSDIRFYPLLSLFFKTHYPDIKLAADAEAELLIRDLTNSGSFAATHAVVASLASLEHFTPAQLNAIVSAYVTNGQIRRILHDDDVKAFIVRVTKGREADVGEENRRALGHLLNSPEDDVFWDVNLAAEPPAG